MGRVSARGLGKLQGYGAGHLRRSGAESLLSLHLDTLSMCMLFGSYIGLQWQRWLSIPTQEILIPDYVY